MAGGASGCPQAVQLRIRLRHRLGRLLSFPWGKNIGIYGDRDKYIGNPRKNTGTYNIGKSRRKTSLFV